MSGCDRKEVWWGLRRKKAYVSDASMQEHTIKKRGALLMDWRARESKPTTSRTRADHEPRTRRPRSADLLFERRFSSLLLQLPSRFHQMMPELFIARPEIDLDKRTSSEIAQKLDNMYKAEVLLPGSFETTEHLLTSGQVHFSTYPISY